MLFLRKALIFILIAVSASAFAARPKHTFVKIETEKGECIVMLYNITPKHRDNFIRLCKERYFNGTLFHRVISGFMIQGGDPESKNAAPGQALGSGGPEYRIDAEFRPGLFHKKGALAAARDNNPEKASSGSQFYIVQGTIFNDARLDELEKHRLGKKIPAAHRNIYKTIGGAPHLDQSYTVFGEIVTGIEMVDRIAAVKTDMADRPADDISMKITLLKRRESRKLEKKLELSEKP